MRKLILLLFMCCSLAINSQQNKKYYAYCCVEYENDGTINVELPNISGMLADKDNKPLKIKSLIGAINEMAKLGFEYVDIINPNSFELNRRTLMEIKHVTVDYILMKKLVSSEQELENGLHFYKTIDNTKKVKVELTPLK